MMQVSDCIVDMHISMYTNNALMFGAYAPSLALSLHYGKCSSAQDLPWTQCVTVRRTGHFAICSMESNWRHWCKNRMPAKQRIRV